ncbi:hypothetical protein IQ07DRAFT_584420 [Pyrenochaeta sp. DS3sAY3a]|nr:hypothetical protein IQ07DRAFT_584420 [Pyrenochaeta sp. DS3sAY3a]
MSESRAAHDKAASPEAVERITSKVRQAAKHGSRKSKGPKLDKAKCDGAELDACVAMPPISNLPRQEPPEALATTLEDSTSLPDQSVTLEFGAKVADASLISSDDGSDLINTVIEPDPDSHLTLTRLKHSDRFGYTYEAEQIDTSTMFEVRVYSFGRQSSAEKKSARRNCQKWKDRRRFQSSHQANGLVYLILRYPGSPSSETISPPSTSPQRPASLLDALSKPPGWPFNMEKPLPAYHDSPMRKDLSFLELGPDAVDFTSTPPVTMPETSKTIDTDDKAHLQGVSFFYSRQEEKSERQKEKARIFQRQKRQKKRDAASRSTLKGQKLKSRAQLQPPNTYSSEHLSSSKKKRYCWSSDWYYTDQSGWVRNLVISDRGVQRRAFCYEDSPYAAVNEKELAGTKTSAEDKSALATIDSEGGTFDIYSDPVLIKKILDFLFSEDNLRRDTTLRKYMTSDGFVAVAVLAGVKQLRRFNVDVIKSACRDMESIELSKEMDGFDRVRLRKDWKRWVLKRWERHPSAMDGRPPAMRSLMRFEDREIPSAGYAEWPSLEATVKRLSNFDDWYSSRTGLVSF